MNNTQLKLPNLHNLSRNTPYKKKFLYTLYISKKKDHRNTCFAKEIPV